MLSTGRSSEGGRRLLIVVVVTALAAGILPPGTAAAAVPQVTPVPDQIANGGYATTPGLPENTVEIDVEWTDGDPGDVHEVRVDWGDGEVVDYGEQTSPFTVQHTYAETGFYYGLAYVRDAAGTEGYTFPAFYTVVLDVPPEAEAKFVSPDPSPERFGDTVEAVDGLLLVGASREDQGRGNVHIFERDDTRWSLQQTVTAASRQQGADFGTAIALDGDTLAVGSAGRDHGGVESVGVVHVFEPGTTGWVETQLLSPPGGAIRDNFGLSVALDGDRLAVGDPSHDWGGARLDEVGAVYLYERDAVGTWQFLERLRGPSSDLRDRFGVSVALDGELLVVGAPGSTASESNPNGTVFAYRWDETGVSAPSSWPGPTVPEDAATGAQFGSSVALNGAGHLVVGAPGGTPPGSEAPWGSVGILPVTDIPSLSEPMYVAATGGQHEFGRSVAMEGDVVAVQTFDRSFDSNPRAVLLEPADAGGNWTQTRAFDPSPGEVGAGVTPPYERRVALDAGRLYMTYPRDNDAAGTSVIPAGAAYAWVVGEDSGPPTLRLRGIEVNQAVQTLGNDVTLYRGKDTVARVFLERLDDASPTHATGMLHGSVNGVALDGSPLAPTDGPLAVPDDISADEDEDTDVIESARARLDGSLNFVLPHSWTTRSGQLRLEFELTDPADQALSCEEPGTVADCEVPVGFVAAPRPVMEFISHPVRSSEIHIFEVNATGGTFRLVSDGDQSDPLDFDATAEDVDDALQDLLGIRDGRVRVADPGGGTYVIRIMRGLDEPDLAVDPTGLSGGTATMTKQQDGGTWEAPSQRDLMEQVRRHSDAMPTDVIDFRLAESRGFQQPPTLLKANTRLSLRRFLDRITEPERTPFELHLSGLLLDIGPESTITGLAWGWVANTYLVRTEDPRSTENARNIPVHEAGHLYGKAHALFERRAVQSVGLCGSTGTNLADLHPFFSELPTTNTGVTEQEWASLWPTIGPLDAEPDDEVWGFSPRALANGFDELTIVDPRRSVELMSYCNPGVAGQRKWPSSFTYGRLRDGVQRAEDRVPDPWDGTDGAYVLVPGSVDESSGTADVGPVVPMAGGPPDADPGEVNVTLLDAAGATLGSADVELQVYGEDDHSAYGVGPTTPGFVAPVPVDSTTVDIATAVVSVDGMERGRVEASANAPTVTLTSPTAGTAATGTIPISWDADDADGDPLMTTIQYSTDDGGTWEVLGFDDEGGRSYAAPTRFLEGSSAARIRVTVSDGLRSAVATSPAFSVDAGRPVVSIAGPSDGATVDADSAVNLTGDAWDPGDGLLEGDALTWSSDLDGSLGNGRAVHVPAGGLQPGCHLVTLTASDGDTRTGTDAVHLDVGGAGGCVTVTEPGTIVIERHTDPSGGPVASFTSDLPGLAAFDLPDDGALLADDLVAGTYTLTQTSSGADHALASLTCDDPSGGTTTDLASGAATIDLEADETVVCRFVDEPGDTNGPPTATDDSYDTAADTVLTLSAETGVLANDTDPDGDPLTVVAVDGEGGDVGRRLALASGALLTVEADGALVYDPNGSFEDLSAGDETSDAFAYTVSDGDATDTAVVTMTVSGVADPDGGGDGPVVEVTPATQEVDHSDAITPVEVMATTAAGATLDLTLGEDAPSWATLTPTGCAPEADAVTCTATVTGTVTTAAGVETILVTATDAGSHTTAEVVVVVQPEQISVQLERRTGPHRPPWDLAPDAFQLLARFTEQKPDLGTDPKPGDLRKADARIELVPTGSGPTIVGECSTTFIGRRYGTHGIVTCTFDGVDEGSYALVVTVDGGFYSGTHEQILTVAADGARSLTEAHGLTAGAAWRRLG